MSITLTNLDLAYLILRSFCLLFGFPKGTCFELLVVGTSTDRNLLVVDVRALRIHHVMVLRRSVVERLLLIEHVLHFLLVNLELRRWF